MELNIATLSDFVKLADVLFVKGANSIDQAMRNSGMVKEVGIPANSGNTREFSEIDLEEYDNKFEELMTVCGELPK